MTTDRVKVISRRYDGRIDHKYNGRSFIVGIEKTIGIPVDQNYRGAVTIRNVHEKLMMANPEISKLVTIIKAKSQGSELR